MTQTIFTRDGAKARAKALRAQAAAEGKTMSQSLALEQVAHENGFSNWNTLSARLSNAPELSFAIGNEVSGRYLRQAFSGRIVSVRELSGGSAYEVEIDFDVPVDVVTFDSFSAFRKRVRVTLSSGGVSYTKTSDGVPHMVVEQVAEFIV